MMEKLKVLKSNLKVWNKEVFGRVEKNNKKALQKVAAWDDTENQRPLSLDEVAARLATMEDFKWSVMEETSWKQKSREIWLKEGDRNTGFFHIIANSHKRRNNIERIQIRGVWVNGDDEVRTGIVNAFKELMFDP